MSPNYVLSIDPPPLEGAFPEDYSLTRSLLTANPTALVTGEDWQDITSNQDIWDKNIFHHVSGEALEDTLSCIHEPSDPTFTNTVKCFQRDGSALKPWTVSGTRVHTGINKAWYRWTMKFENGFSNSAGGNNCWKVFFGEHRIIEACGTAYQDLFPHGYGGSEAKLPNSETTQGNIVNEYTDEQWYEWIGYQERVSSTHYRARVWRRKLTTADVIDGPASSATWANRWGWETTGATVPANDMAKIQPGVNRNGPMGAGDEQHWFWGPLEVLDGDVITDPYGIESQIK